jgi:hypothetical protein
VTLPFLSAGKGEEKSSRVPARATAATADQVRGFDFSFF